MIRSFHLHGGREKYSWMGGVIKAIDPGMRYGSTIELKSGESYSEVQDLQLKNVEFIEMWMVALEAENPSTSIVQGIYRKFCDQLFIVPPLQGS